MPPVQNFSGDDLIVVTGGAGFIGSNIVLQLARAGERVVVCDLFRSGEKWRNIAAAWLHDIVRPNDLPQWLGRHGDKVAAIVHMAAISSTTEKDVDKFVETNIRLTLDLWDWCAAHAVRLIYASSAATYGQGRAGESVTLFRSHDPRYPDGGQLRDFVYVKDCVAVVRWLLGHPETSGLFNVGTGTARSFLDLVRAVCVVVGCTPNIRFIDTPEDLRTQYQYFTCADITKLRRAGFGALFYSLEDGVRDYLAQLP